MGQRPAGAVVVLPEAARFSGFPRMMSIGLHSRLVGQAARASALKEFIEYVLDKGEVWFARRIDIANGWNEHHEEFK